MSSGFRHFLIIAALAGSTLFSYWNVDKCGFIDFDDQDYVTKNHHVFPGPFAKSTLVWAFTSFHSANWHPLTWISHALDYKLYGLKPAGHHLTSLLFHIINTVLLFFALKSMTGTLWRSALVAALFGLHPLHVESVVWVSERKDVLCAFFMFITLLFYSSYVHHGRHKGFYFATLFSFILGLMSKPMLVTLPFVLLLCDFWPMNRFQFEKGPDVAQNMRRRFFLTIPLIVEKTPFFFLSFASCIVTAFAQKAFGAMQPVGNLPFFFRINNSLSSYMEYLIKTVWPVHLSFFYPLVQGLPVSHWRLSAAVLLILLITTAAIVRIRKQPFLLVGWLWFLGTLVPVIGIVQVGSQAMADRYTYVPLVGVFIIISWLLHDLVHRNRWLQVAAASCCVVALALLACQSRRQTGYWKNDLALSEHALSVTRYNYLASCMKGTYLLNAGDYDKAITCFTQSLALCPSQTVPRLNIGCALLCQGKTRDALEAFKSLIASDPSSAIAYLNCGKAYTILGKNDSAIACFSHAIALDTCFYTALYNLGKLYEFMGDYKKGIPYLERTCRLGPEDPAAVFDLGTCYFKTGRFDSAIKWNEKSISLDHYFVPAHRQMAMALDSIGKHDLAKRHVFFADSVEAVWNKLHPKHEAKQEKLFKK
jgi:Flp pilus assembly protein TadD